jgi:hypothetical protein
MTVRQTGDHLMVGAEPATRVLEALGAERRPDFQREWSALVDRQSGLASWHAASSPATMADLAVTLRDAPIVAPRTGHIADWRDMACGCSSVLDYNGIICRELAAGYPLQYDFSQTETQAGDGGDTLFLPGSLVERGVRRALPLFRWSDRGFVAHDRSTPLFVPFVVTEHEGARLPLTQLHRRRARELGWFDVDYHSDLLVRCREQVREMLTVLVTAAGRDDRKLAQVFDRVLHRDGRIERVPVTAAGGGWQVADQRFATVVALVEASLVPAVVAQSTEPLDAALRQAPAVMPFASMNVVHLLHAMLGTHRLDRRPAGDGAADVHVQWGALAMAGYPPGKRGYFAGKASKVKQLATTVVRELAWPSPTLFALVPTAPYLLWVPASRPDDLAAIEALLRRVAPVVARWPNQTVRTSPEVHEIADGWLAGEGRGVSVALRQQFGWADRTSHAGPLPEADMVRPAGFDDLTVGDACLVVAAVIKAFRSAT